MAALSLSSPPVRACHGADHGQDSAIVCHSLWTDYGSPSVV